MRGTAAAASRVLTVSRTSFRAGLGQRLHLAHGGRDIDGIGIGHRLQTATAHRRADQHSADPHLAAGATDYLRHHCSRELFFKGGYSSSVKRATVASIKGVRSMGRPL